MSQDGFSKRGRVLLNKRKIVKLAQKIACAAGAILLSFLCIVPCFASTGYENYPTENEYGLTLTEEPFLTLNFAVSGTQGMSAQGFYRVPRWLFEYSNYSFIIANGGSYAIGYRTSDGQWWTYEPAPNEDLIFRYERGRLPNTYDKTDVPCSITLYCANGRVINENGLVGEYNTEFLMTFVCGYVPITKYEDNTIYVHLDEAYGYRNAYADAGYIYTRAPLGSIRLRFDGSSTETYNNLLDLHCNFFLPYNALNTSYWNSEGDLTLRLGMLLDMVNFDYGLLPSENWDYEYRPAWYLSFGEYAYLAGYDKGVSDTEIPSYNRGLEAGKALGYDLGYDDGNLHGWESGKQYGYTEGLKTADVGNVGNLMSGIFEGIYNFFNAILNFDIPIGNTTINFASIAGMLIALIVIIIVVRFILR